MLSCIIALCYGFYLLAQQQANPNQEKQTHMLNQNKANIHIAHTISSQVRLKQGWTAEASQLYRVVFALNPDIESQGEADER